MFIPKEVKNKVSSGVDLVELKSSIIFNLSGTSNLLYKPYVESLYTYILGNRLIQPSPFGKVNNQLLIKNEDKLNIYLDKMIARRFFQENIDIPIGYINIDMKDFIISNINYIKDGYLVCVSPKQKHKSYIVRVEFIIKSFFEKDLSEMNTIFEVININENNKGLNISTDKQRTNPDYSELDDFPEILI